jgi:FMN-dependent oxidoreductase (nitrilotriacetate monooxygenase family)
MTGTGKQLHLAAFLQGVNSTTVWSDPAAGSQVAFSSFAHMARTAERGTFDFFFLAEGLRLREQKGLIHELDVVGRPESIAVLSALAAVTERLGLAATMNTTYNEPYELARRFATLDLLSGGRAGWNIVTSSDAFTGENFRRGGYLQHDERYTRAAEFAALATELWGSWQPGAVAADRATGQFLRDERVQQVRHRGPQFDVEATATLPRSPQGRPVVIQAGDSDEGRAFAAATADVVFSRHSTLEAGQAFFRDLKARAVGAGRRADDVKIMPAVSWALGATGAEAAERAAQIRFQQVSPANAIAFAEQVWNRDLSDCDPDGPLPTVEPDVEGELLSQGRAASKRVDRVAVAEQWRELSRSRGLTLRETAAEMSSHQSFVGTAEGIADQMIGFLDADACDGFVLTPHINPAGLDDFVDQVVPVLRERGRFRTAYTSTTLRGHLGLDVPETAEAAEAQDG